MTPEFWAIVGAIFAMTAIVFTLLLALTGRIERRVDRLEAKIDAVSQHLTTEIRAVGERVARLEGMIEMFRDTAAGRDATAERDAA